MELLGALYFMSARGDVLIQRTYRDDIEYVQCLVLFGLSWLGRGGTGVGACSGFELVRHPGGAVVHLGCAVLACRALRMVW